MASSDEKLVTKAHAQAAEWGWAADCSYKAAMHLFAAENEPLYLVPAAYLGHHALEMFLKAALINGGCTITKSARQQTDDDCSAWGHDLVSLAEKLASRIGNPQSIEDAQEGLKIFNTYFEKARYPSTLTDDFIPIDSQTGKLLTQLWEELKLFAPHAFRGKSWLPLLRTIASAPTAKEPAGLGLDAQRFAVIRHLAG